MELENIILSEVTQTQKNKYGLSLNLELNDLDWQPASVGDPPTLPSTRVTGTIKLHQYAIRCPDSNRMEQCLRKRTESRLRASSHYAR
ncbi:hypothetical protein STEG23_021098, partial [Scotinomys teguina]